MADSSIIPLNKLTATQLTGSTILYAVSTPDGSAAEWRGNLASLLGNMYKITPSVASNNLTLAIQHLDGSAPTANNPMAFKIGDAFNLTSSSISFTKNAATNWCGAGSAETASQDIDFFVYAIAETGVSAGLKFAFSRIAHARTMGDFVNTVTSYKYPAGNWVNFNATDKVINIGRFRARLSATAAFNWSIPNSLVLSFPYYDTDWLTWVPTHVGFSTAPSGGAFRYRLSGSLLTVAYNPLANGTSNATNYTITIPFTARNITDYYQYSTTGWTKDNGLEVANGVLWATFNSNVLTIAKSTLAVWTAANGKIATFTHTVEIE